MKLRILGNRSYLWQWDSGQQLLVEDAEQCHEVHFSLRGDTRALVVPIQDHDDQRVVNVPNILLQTSGRLQAYLFANEADTLGATLYYTAFTVKARPKPEDYVYTETEVLDYSFLDQRLTYLEGEGLANAVADYLKENPIEAGATAEEAAQIQQNKEDIETLNNEKLSAETDPTVPNWAKQPMKPPYTAAEVGAQPADFVVTFSSYWDSENEELAYVADKTFNEVLTAYEAGATIVGVKEGLRYEMYSEGGGEGFGFISRVATNTNYKTIWLWEDDSVSSRTGSLSISHPVTSVNGKTGAVVLSAEDVGALSKDTVIPTVPANLSAFNNDSGYQTAAEVKAIVDSELGVIENGTY